jgi:hypothetical protein
MRAPLVGDELGDFIEGAAHQRKARRSVSSRRSAGLGDEMSTAVQRGPHAHRAARGTGVEGVLPLAHPDHDVRPVGARAQKQKGWLGDA